MGPGSALVQRPQSSMLSKADLKNVLGEQSTRDDSSRAGTTPYVQYIPRVPSALTHIGPYIIDTVFAARPDPPPQSLLPVVSNSPVRSS